MLQKHQCKNSMALELSTLPQKTTNHLPHFTLSPFPHRSPFFPTTTTITTTTISKMSTRHLLHHHLRRTRHHYSTTSLSTTTPSPPPPNLMIYDRLAQSTNSKLSRLNSPDPRFLRYTSPHPIPSDHSHILRFPVTRIYTLPNGLRVATESALSARSASVTVSVDAGSRFEPEETSGVAHFWERLVMGRENESAVNIGAQLSAITTRENSVFSARVLNKDVAKGVEVLAEILQNKEFSEDCVEKVRDSIIREKEKSAEGDQAIFDQLHATAFQYTPLGRPIQGPLNNIKSITKADIQEYISSHYAAHRLVISASGAVKHEDVVEQVKKVFTKLSANPTTTSQLVASEPANFTGSEVRIIDDDLPIAQFGVAFEGASWRDPDSIPLMVMQTMLGSWSKNDGSGKHVGSDLVQMAAINEIAESIKTFNINYNDTGLFGVHAVAKPDCLDDLSYAIMHEISKLSYRVSDDDVIRARNQLKSSLLLRSNGIGAASEDIGHQLLSYGRRIPFAELFARIDAVDASTVKRVANRFIFDRDIAIAAMGPIKGLPDYNWFRRRTYWLRY